MANLSVAEAQERLSDLIGLALAGEGVVITHDGRPVAELKPVQPVQRAPRRMTEADLEWLAARRVGGIMPAMDTGELVSRMRDEDEDW